MQLATDGLPSGGRYEIFDKSDTFGTPPSCRTSSPPRARGELARTFAPRFIVSRACISSFPTVRFSRGTINPFRFGRGEGPCTALSRQVSAIQHLVARRGGPYANNVALIDDKGELLAAATAMATTLRGLSRKNAFRFRRQASQRVENIVSSIVGPGHSRSRSRQIWISTRHGNRRDVRSEARLCGLRRRFSRIPRRRTIGGRSVSVATAIPGSGRRRSVATTLRFPKHAQSKKPSITRSPRPQKRKRWMPASQETVRRRGRGWHVCAGANARRNYAPRSGDDMTRSRQLVRSAIASMKSAAISCRSPICALPISIPARNRRGAGRAWARFLRLFKLAQILILSITPAGLSSRVRR